MFIVCLQAAMLTERITRMASHLAANRGDKDCKRNLTMATVTRRKILAYMQRRDYGGYRLAVKELGIRPLPIFQSAYLPKVRGLHCCFRCGVDYATRGFTSACEVCL